MNVCGIYQIKNLINDKVYVGKSTKTNVRWSAHKYLLKLNQHYNKQLQEDWNQYGSENFEFSILELCDCDNLKAREKYWIDFFESYSSKGYNINQPYIYIPPDVKSKTELYLTGFYVCPCCKRTLPDSEYYSCENRSISGYCKKCISDKAKAKRDLTKAKHRCDKCGSVISGLGD